MAYRSREFDITSWAYEEGEVIRSVEVIPTCKVSDGNALFELVLAGVGVGYVSRFAARNALRTGALIRLFPEVHLPPFEPLFVIQAPTEHPRRKVQAFKAHLRAVVEAQRAL